MTKLKNQYSTMPINRIFETIKKELTRHNAAKIIEDYGADQRIEAISFTMNIEGLQLAYRLPARIRNVEIKLYGSKPLSATQKEQAYRVGWANIKDWISSQMALIDIGLVKPEEVLLPYMLNSEGKTLFDLYEKNQFRLGSGEK